MPVVDDLAAVFEAADRISFESTGVQPYCMNYDDDDTWVIVIDARHCNEAIDILNSLGLNRKFPQPLYINPSIENAKRAGISHEQYVQTMAVWPRNVWMRVPGGKHGLCD